MVIHNDTNTTQSVVMRVDLEDAASYYPTGLYANRRTSGSYTLTVTS